MFNKKLKATIASFIIFGLSLSGYIVSANSDTTKVSFSMKEVKVVDANTIKISFSKNLLDTAIDTADFALTSKKDETKIMDFSGYTLSAPNELTAKTNVALNIGEEYNLTAIFISDEEGNLIENGVDGSISFIATFDKATEINTNIPTAETSVPTNETSLDDNKSIEENIEEALNTDLNAASEQSNLTENTSTETGSGTNTELAAASTEALPKTGTTENILVILALIMSLGFFIFKNSIYKKA